MTTGSIRGEDNKIGFKSGKFQTIIIFWNISLSERLENVKSTVNMHNQSVFDFSAVKTVTKLILRQCTMQCIALKIEIGDL